MQRALFDLWELSFWFYELIADVLDLELGSAEHGLAAGSAAGTAPFVFHDIVEAVALIAHALTFDDINLELGIFVDRLVLGDNRVVPLKEDRQIPGQLTDF